jgi:glutamyl-tRNA reductase
VSSVFVANRHYDRAIGLAQRFGGRALRFDALPAQLESADIVLSSTASPHHIIERDELAAVMAARDRRPLLLIDLAVPRDIDPAVAELPGVFLRDVDDLQRVVERNLSGRESEARRAEALLDHEVGRFTRWLETLEVVPTIAALNERGEEVARQVLAENANRWESLADADRERIELVAATVARRLLQQPMLRLKARGDERTTYAYVQALRELFGLEVERGSAFAASERPDEAVEPASADVTPIRRRRGRRRR